MKLRTLSIALATAGLGLTMSVQAAGISDDDIRIGFIADMSGVYADIDGNAGADAIRMAIADMGGEINGKKIELLTADHQNKARSEAHTSELQSHMRISYAVFCLK